MSKITPIYIPPIEIEDTNNLDPQVITYRAPNVPGLYLDSTIRRTSTANANSVVLTTSNSNILINRIRRIAVKDFTLFYYLDNIITGFNDTFTINFRVIAPDPPSITAVTVTIPQDIYTIEELGETIETLLNDWMVANWGSMPLPIFTVTYVAPTVEGLFGQLEITATYLISTPLIAIDPDCSFVVGSTGMLALTRSNNFVLPTTPILRLSFFSDVPYRYIDVVSHSLTKDSKIQSTTNLDTNYKIIHRIVRPHVGYNVEVLNEPLNWININADTCLTQLDFTFLGPDGLPIRGAITRDFWWLAEISMQR